MSVNQDIRNKLLPDTVVFDNHAYDNSIIGTTFDGRAIYSFEQMVLELMQDNSYGYEDAVKWIEYNTIHSLPYAGEKRPLVVYTDEEQ